jgi:hypothetical protein
MLMGSDRLQIPVIRIWPEMIIIVPIYFAQTIQDSILVKLRQSISDPASRGDKILNDWQRERKKKK